MMDRYVLKVCCLFVALVAGSASAASEKLDHGLDNPEERYPVFVRMADQLLGHSGDYERFAAKHADARRRALRSHVIGELKSKADRSWRSVRSLVGELESDGQLERVTRFWVVNGFAAQATGEACRRLAESPDVEFVYLQTAPLRLHVMSQTTQTIPERLRDEGDRDGVLREILAGWRDDSDDPLSLEGVEIPWNLQRIKADAAWRDEGATGRGVVVALTDTGLMPVPPLTAALWRNSGEELNGEDDDGNGYIDDLFGYDFIGGHGFPLGDRGVPHGSICAGIIAGRPINNRNLITGIAPRSKVMVLRGMGYLQAYEYALDHGADVMSMSFMFIGRELGNYRGVYRTAHEHMAAAGIVAVGGAGNFSRLPEGRQIAIPKDIPCVIAAAGIVEDGSRASFSSGGPCYWEGVKFYDDYPKSAPLAKPDVTGIIGGYPMWAHPIWPRGPLEIISKESDVHALVIGPQGNSFSGPHAAGVAALMLSANPELPAWEVKALMEQTCTDLGEPGHDTVFGAGLLNALEAARAAKAAAR